MGEKAILQEAQQVITTALCDNLLFQLFFKIVGGRS